MEKNTIVLDELGNEIGFTYPKRARGLVRNGRAEYVDDCTIRFKRAHAPTVINEIMEEHKMSEILNFNARDFRIDKTYQGNGSRMFITDMFGDNVEIYHLADNTRIYSDKVLEPNAEYKFRFAITGDSNNPNEVSQCIIVPQTGEALSEEDWENSYVFCLSQDQYKPSLRKRWGNSTVRIFEIPFRTEAAGKVRILFLEQKAMTRLMPAREDEAYAQLPDCEDGAYSREIKPPFGIKLPLDSSPSFGPRKEANNTVYGHSVFSPEGNLYCSNENMSGDKLVGILSRLDDGSHLELTNCNISNPTNIEDIGATLDGSSFVLSNVNMEGNAFSAILEKLGDGCSIDCTNVVVSAVQGTYVGVEGNSDGCDVNLTNTDITASAFGYLMATLNDGFTTTMNNVEVIEDGSDFDFGPRSDGAEMVVSNSNIPVSVCKKIYAKMGYGCSVMGI